MNMDSLPYNFTNLAVATALGLTLPISAATETFSTKKHGGFSKLDTALGTFTAGANNAGVAKQSASGNSGSLHIQGGKNKSVTLKLSQKLASQELLGLSFQAERWTGAAPFKFRVEAQSADGQWKEVFNGDKVKVGGFNPTTKINLRGKKYTAIRFTATTKDKSGVLIDNITVSENKDMVVASVKQIQRQVPLLIRKNNSALLNLQVNAEGAKKPETITGLHLSLDGTTNLADIESLAVYSTGNNGTLDLSKATKLWSGAPEKTLKIAFQQQLSDGTNNLWVVPTLSAKANFANRVDATATALALANGDVKKITNNNDITQRIGFNVATGGDKVLRTTGETITCKRMRIPGMVTSKAGSILAVYDLRWFQNGDLPGDIDVGLSRSTDNGQSWEAPRPVMDMGKFRNLPENKNGVGDPAILVDNKTGHIFISGLMAHGLSAGWYWGKSKPGMDPKDTGQVIINKSTDDGKTWSEPLNITSKIKDPAWQLMLQGPGAGICLRDGTLVFAFQYKVNLGTKEKPKYSARSSIMYSKDNGANWTVAEGVNYPSETTEAQVVELDDGSLMLNCRISAGGRAVFTTKNLGKTWERHPTSGRGTFNMTGCMASILRYSSVKDGDAESILLFSGPADGGKKRRSHMAIRYSKDEGKTWSKPYVLDELGGAYSCLCITGKGKDKHINIIYEGSQSNMTFEQLTLEEIITGSK